MSKEAEERKLGKSSYLATAEADYRDLKVFLLSDLSNPNQFDHASHLQIR